MPPLSSPAAVVLSSAEAEELQQQNAVLQEALDGAQQEVVEAYKQVSASFAWGHAGWAPACWPSGLHGPPGAEGALGLLGPHQVLLTF